MTGTFMSTGFFESASAGEERELRETHSAPVAASPRAETYATFAEAIVRSFLPSVDDMRTWWSEETDNRENHGVVAGTSAYDRVVRACEARKRELATSEPLTPSPFG